MGVPLHIIFAFRWWVEDRLMAAGGLTVVIPEAKGVGV